jgi:hypothetical protein
MNMRLIAIISTVLAVLLAVDGIYMVVTNYKQGETQAFNLPDGWIIIISAGVLVVVAVIALVLSMRTRLPGGKSTMTGTEVKS